MKFDNEIVIEEGKINNIPKTINASYRLLNNSTKKDQRNSINNVPLNTIKNKMFIKNYISKLKSVGSNSTTSINSNNDKIKKVTFSTVEIIRIKNYKQFNKLNSYLADEKRNKISKYNKNDICSII